MISYPPDVLAEPAASLTVTQPDDSGYRGNCSQIGRSNVGHLPALTGLRGVAALWVVFFHLLPSVPILRRGYMGVDIFFILSGFILSHVYQDAFTKYSVREHFRFLLIRLARIYPLHIFALVLLVAIVLLLPGFTIAYAPGTYSTKNFVISALLLQNWHRNPLVWNAPAWTLSVEWVAYLAFPLLLLAARKVRSGGHAIVLALLSLTPMSVLLIWNGSGLNHPGTKAGFLRMASEFTAGCLIQRLSFLHPHWKPRSGPGALAVALFAVSLWSPLLTPLAVLPFGYLIALLARPSGALVSLLGSTVAVFLGEISYSIYLMHFALLQTANYCVRLFPPMGVPGNVAANLTTLAGIIAVATLTWKYVERPARDIGRKIAAKLTGPATKERR